MEYLNLNFLSPQDPRLNIKATEVLPEHITSPEIKAIVDRLLELALGTDQASPRRFLNGLAANQVGINKRIIVVDTRAHYKGEELQLKAYINPEIIWHSEEIEEKCEGCLSTGKIHGIVPRAKSIKIKAYGLDGKQIEEYHEGETARILQHEIDHLNGIRFPARIMDDNKLHWVEEDELIEYLDSHNWQAWSKKCPRETWLRMERGTD